MDGSIQSIGDVALQQSMMADTVTRGAMPNRIADKGVSVDQAAKDFEAVFVSQMLQPMWEGVEVDDQFGGGHGEEVVRGLLIQEYGKAISKSGGFGLSDAIKAEMIQMQAEANHKSSSNMDVAGKN